MRDLIDASIELQLRIELAADGFLLGDRGNASAGDILKLVLERRHAFEQFLPQSFWMIEYINMNTISWELSDGVGGRSPDKREEGSTFRSLHFQELLPPDTPGGIWSVDHDDLEVDTSDISFWLNGDTLFLVEFISQGDIWRIHFRHLSTSETHRRAFAPFIDFSKGSHLIWESCELLCYEERILAQFFDHRDPDRAKQMAAIVFDWTTGDVMMPYTTTLDITFLTKDFLVLAIPVATENGTTLLEVRPFEGGKASYRCELPISWRDCSVRFLGHPCSKQGVNCPTRYAKLFIPDPSLDILAIVLKASESRYSRTVVLSIDLFLRKCQHLVTSNHTEEHVTPTFEWDLWGPAVTRWLPDNFLGEFGIRTVYGARMVTIRLRNEKVSQNFTTYSWISTHEPYGVARLREMATATHYGFKPGKQKIKLMAG